ncbi:hypothetical protein H2264_00440 [Campylobacter sp. RM10541]|uniref:hypothetical protein n=1 Tax=Campylobacter molothri TaxID=1032242 RepID=UPI001DB5D266|nr:hypothetical protein [Campylobacter sp. RM10536]MBZ7956247.1 hypothetical protein [Campylobacter sp. RM10541]
MLIFGHPLVKNLNFNFIEKIENLQNDQISCFFYDEKIIQKAKNENLDFAIFIQNKNEIFLSNAFEAKFLIFKDEKLAKFASEVAEFYLFDSKILMMVENFDDLEKAYDLRVDGVILKDFIKNYKIF